MKYKTRYSKEHYTRIWIRRDTYTRLVELCNRLNTPLVDCLDYIFNRQRLESIAIKLAYAKFIPISELTELITSLSLEEKIEISHRVISEALRISKLFYGEAKVLHNFSGGKASLVTLDLILQHIPRDELLVHYNNTLNDFPETRSYVIWVVKEYYKVAKLIETRPRFKPWDIWRIFGFPRQNRLERYTPVCCVILKEIPAKLVIEKYGITVDITGIQAVESKARLLSLADNALIRRTKYIGTEIQLKRSVIRVAPVGLWTEENIWEYIRRNKLPVNPVYKKYNTRRTGCVACTNFVGWEKALMSYSPRLYEYVKAKIEEWGIQERRVRYRELREKLEKELGASKLEDLYELIEY